MPLYEPRVGTSGSGFSSCGMLVSSSPSLFNAQPLSSRRPNIFRQAARYTPCIFQCMLEGVPAPTGSCRGDTSYTTIHARTATLTSHSTQLNTHITQKVVMNLLLIAAMKSAVEVNAEGQATQLMCKWAMWARITTTAAQSQAGLA